MKFKVGDKVKTPRGGEGTIISRSHSAIILEAAEYRVRIDEPNPYTIRWGELYFLYYRESELQSVEHDQNATKIAKSSDI